MKICAFYVPLFQCTNMGFCHGLSLYSPKDEFWIDLLLLMFQNNFEHSIGHWGIHSLTHSLLISLYQLCNFLIGKQLWWCFCIMLVSLSPKIIWSTYIHEDAMLCPLVCHKIKCQSPLLQFCLCCLKKLPQFLNPQGWKQHVIQNISLFFGQQCLRDSSLIHPPTEGNSNTC